jgi:hypothetical protein
MPLDFSQKLSARKSHLRHWGNRCAYCGKKLSLKEMTLDHFIPRGRNGSQGALNTLPACKKCNCYKARTHPAKYIFSIQDKQTAQQTIDDIMTYLNFRYYLNTDARQCKRQQKGIQTWYNTLWSWMDNFTSVRRIDHVI